MELNTVLQTNITEVKEKMAYSVEGVAEMTTLSKAFIRNEIKVGNLKSARFGRRVLVLRKDLEAYLEKGSNGRGEN